MAEAFRDRQERRENGGGLATGPTAAVGPGLSFVQSLSPSSPDLEDQILGAIRRHPAERDEILSWTYGATRGSGVGQRVGARLGNIESLLPDDFALRSVSASVTLNAKQLSSSASHTASIRNGTSATVTIRPTGVSISFHPGIYIDATWPLRNVSTR